MKKILGWALTWASYFCILASYMALMYAGYSGFMFFVGLHLLFLGSAMVLEKLHMPECTLFLLSSAVLLTSTWATMLRIDGVEYWAEDAMMFGTFLGILTYAKIYIPKDINWKDWFK